MLHTTTTAANVPVPPAPVTTATPGSDLTSDDMFVRRECPYCNEDYLPCSRSIHVRVDLVDRHKIVISAWPPASRGLGVDAEVPRTPASAKTLNKGTSWAGLTIRPTSLQFLSNTCRHMHKLTHTCSHCSRSFKRAEHLTRHLRTRRCLQMSAVLLKQAYSS